MKNLKKHSVNAKQFFRMTMWVKNFKILVSLVVLVFFVNVLFAKNAKTASEDKSMHVGTSVYVSEGTQMTLSGNLTVKTSSNAPCLRNDGLIFFNSSAESTVDLPSGEYGSGELNFTGKANYNMNTGNGAARVGVLTMNLTDAAVALNGELTVSNKLQLKNGRVNVGNSSVLWIDNPSVDAVVVSNNTLINKSYVTGYLTRSVLAGKRYEFPVGNTSDYHPFLVEKPKSTDVVSVLFDEEVPTEIHSYNANLASNMINSTGWRVESDLNEQNDFLAGLSSYNTGQEAFASQLEVVYLSDLEKTGSVTSSILDGAYVLGAERKSAGLYAFNQSVGVNLVNFITVADGNDTFFEIPNSTDYSLITFKVYNSLGSLVFKSQKYNGEFDARDFPEGTYYYELTLVKDEKESIIRRFIDINYEK